MIDIVFALAVSGLITLDAPPPGPSLPRRELAEAIRLAVDQAAGRAIAAGLAPGLGVAVVFDGEVLYARSHGFADTSAGVPGDDDTLWYVASTSKALTGFGTALLAHRGPFTFETPIPTLLPKAQWPPAISPRELTLAHFLAHTHHLDDDAIVYSAAYTGAMPESCWPQLLAQARPSGNQDLVYSNLGYNVAAMVLDAHRPEGWRQFLESEVYRPAGMMNTFARVSGLAPRRIAKPHRLRPDGRFAAETFAKTDATMNSAGGHLTTPGDLAHFAITQMDGGKLDGRQVFPAAAVELGQRLLARQTRETAKRFSDFDREGWAAGWDLGAYQGEPMVSRFGGYHTFHSHLSFLPRRRIGVVVFANGGPGARIANWLATLVYDLEAQRPDARARAEARWSELLARFTTDRERLAENERVRAERQRQPLRHPLADFAGTYFHPALGGVEVTFADDRLAYRWGAVSGPLEIFDAAKDELRLEIAGGGEVAGFRFGESGPAQALRLVDHDFPRVVPGAPLPSLCGTAAQ